MKKWQLFSLLTLIFNNATVKPFQSLNVNAHPQRPKIRLSAVFPDFIPEEANKIKEMAAVDVLSNMKRCKLHATPDIFNVDLIDTSFISVNSKNGDEKETAPILLLHGFDSSCLEFRRLMPLLGAAKFEAYAVDILGWGFSQLKDISNFGTTEKRAHLYSFWQEIMGGKPMVICGASLGAAVAIDFCLSYPQAVEKLVLIDGQALIDGSGPGKDLPDPLARLGINILRSVPLRSLANRMAYFDKDRYATEDALNIGRLHTFQEGWKEASLSYMKSGGYTLSDRLGEVNVPVLVLWGRQDGILDPSKYASQYGKLMKNSRLVWIENCGHVPHLEQPQDTADAITDFVKETILPLQVQ